MLEIIAAANSAYAIIRTAIANGKELSSCGKAIAQFTHAQDDLRNKAHKDKNSFWAKVAGKEDSDLESFMALEKIKQQEQQLKEAMIYYGRPGLHSDYVRFCVEARKSREHAKKEKEQAWEKLQENILLGILWLLGIGVITAIVVGIVWGLRNKGMI